MGIRTSSVSLSVKLLSEKFLIIYELEGCQKAVNYLTKYYGIRRMRIFLNGRKVGRSCIAYYLEERAYFKKEGLNKRVVLHELYHHLVDCNDLELRLRAEEREANQYARSFFPKFCPDKKLTKREENSKRKRKVTKIGSS